MGVYDAITDPTNRFDVSGISDEDRALLSYLVAAKAATGIDVVATCTTDHPAGATRHLQPGTNGRGLAIDCRLRRRGNDIHRAVFELFVPIQRQLYELIYADPPSDGRTDGRFGPYNIKAGKRVAPYAVSEHRDHVHVAVNRGTFVRFPISPAPPVPPPPLPQEDDVAVIVTKTNNQSFVTDYVTKRPILGTSHFDQLVAAGVKGAKLSDDHIDAIPVAT